MKSFQSISDLKTWRQSLDNERVGFVPTMGALHQGHLSLIEKSLTENQKTVVSIYVNTTQFNDPNDLKSYPSSTEADLALLRSLRVDAVFLPDDSTMYPDNYRYRVIENQDSLELCGKDRPGHFDGVLTVVMKLFNLVKPHKAYFGEKDFQQLQLIRSMVDSFFMDIEIVPCVTHRDANGLALSSRNSKLNPDELIKARYFASELKKTKNIETLKEKLREKNVTVDYIIEKNQRRFAAVKIGSVRLIDNVEI